MGVWWVGLALQWWAGLLQAEAGKSGKGSGCLTEASAECCQEAGQWEEAWCQVPKARRSRRGILSPPTAAGCRRRRESPDPSGIEGSPGEGEDDESQLS